MDRSRSELLRLAAGGPQGRRSVRAWDGRPARVPDFFIRTAGGELICRECGHATTYGDGKMPPSRRLIDCPGCRLPSRVPGAPT